MKDTDKKEAKKEKVEADKSTTATAQNVTEKKRTKKTVIVKSVKQGAGLIAKSGDFIGRLGTLLVMIVTSINTGTIMVTSFIEGVYWKGGVHAFLLVFIHLPVIVVMIWLMCKARVQAIYRKIRPSKPGETITVTDVEDEEAVVIEETIEVQDDENDGKIEVEKITNGQKETGKDDKKVTEKMKQKTKEEKLKGHLKTTEQINKAFEMSGTL